MLPGAKTGAQDQNGVEAQILGKLTVLDSLEDNIMCAIRLQESQKEE